ncbi:MULTISPECIES: hypothetical protein [unclassified Photobacterium]|uniref:hypothetical protein n=1 Tax=unclassified Photobacterium TaxID=2628852 RepID=UPI001EDCBD4A|nr:MULTISPECIES: hypothetical protein [unclassified Photobacterium]MCG3864476.1 hypothetical protein [Photobacterium sp. Ph6]MCG3877439.1 hypothetical protein [Photobacterium sp. Ph5]
MNNLKIDPKLMSEYVEPTGYDIAEAEHELSLNDWQPTTAEPVEVGAKCKKRPAKISIFEQPIISIDTEYTRSKDGKTNYILSYQFVLLFKGQSTSLILYAKSARKSGRLVFDKCIAQIIKKALNEKILTAWPTEAVVCAHFLKADLFTFSKSFDNFQSYIKGVRKTVATLGNDAYGVDLANVMSKRIDKDPFTLYDESRNKHELKIRFYDTMLLSPSGKSLADVGELVGLSKLEIPEPYNIERMDEYLAADPVGFEAYALRDAEITALHMERMISFINMIGLKNLPYTIGGIAVKAFINSVDLEGNYRSLFGFEPVTKEIWPEGRSKPLTITKDVPRPDRMILESFATQCYHGGRNESFMSGITPVGTWNDYDAPSCYTTILMGLRELDYLHAKQSTCIKDFFGDQCAMVWVEFKFPDDTRFPSLPVRTDSYGLVYPLEGESFCTGHELEVAYNQGAELVIKAGYIVPWKNDDRIFEPFMRWVRQTRLQHKKGGFEERLIKEIGNSCYGKLAQGLRPKTAFDIEVGYSKQMPASTLTNPFFAAYTTGLARALMSEMLNGIPEHSQVVSVTTDGFLTNADIAEIELTGPICNRFREHFYRMDPTGGAILELKHRARQIVAIKTRGQLTTMPYEGYPVVTAKAGVKTPRGINANDYMVDLYLHRVPGQLTDGSHLTSTREMFLQQSDLLNVEREICLNLEFDHKRQLIEPIIRTANDLPHISFQTKPHQTVNDMTATRLRFDRWRLNNCLKTLNDWSSFEDRLAMGLAILSSNVRLKPQERSDELLLRLFLRFCTQHESMGSVGSMNANELAKYFDSIGYSVKAATIRNAKRQKVILSAVPVTRLTVELFKVLAQKFPNMDIKSLFVTEQLSLLEPMLDS